MSARSLTIQFHHPLREVRLCVPPSPQQLIEQQILDREEAAYLRGRMDGEKALSEQLLQQRGELIELQNGVLASLRHAVKQVVRDTEQTLTHLALEVAQKLVAGLPISAEMVAASVREAMNQIEEHTDFHIYLHPEDMELLRRANSDLLEPPTEARQMHFHPSPEVSRGGCLVKTRFGLIDAQRETKVEMLNKSLAA